MKLIVSLDSDVGTRIDTYISNNSEFSRSRIQGLIDDNCITVNNKVITKSYKVKLFDVVEITTPEPIELDVKEEDIPLDIIYEDNDIIVVNKPKNMVVHPACGNYTGTLVSALLHHCKDSLSGIGGVMRPGIVHRIDKDTSGLLVVAKNDEAHISLQAQLKNHTLHRIYHAITIGKIENNITIDKPIGRSLKDRKKMAIIDSGRQAITHVEPIEVFDNGCSYVKCILETGRTHQIRVHLASINKPILGDETYGFKKNPIEEKYKKYVSGQTLHAKELVLIHPRTKEQMSFTSPLPQYFETLIELMKKGQ